MISASTNNLWLNPVIRCEEESVFSLSFLRCDLPELAGLSFHRLFVELTRWSLAEKPRFEFLFTPLNIR